MRGVLTLLLMAMLGGIGCYTILAAFLIDDLNYARACFGLLNMLTVHLVLIRHDIERILRR